MGKRKESKVPANDEDLQDDPPPTAIRALVFGCDDVEVASPKQFRRTEYDVNTAVNKVLCKIIGVEKTATQQEIKKAYYKLALRLRPDKNPGDEDAKEKFQQLQKVIWILGDEEKCSVYDQTGCIDDADLAGDIVQNLDEYFRAVYKKVTEADIEEFSANYRGPSDSENNYLINLCNEFEGNMKRSKKGEDLQSMILQCQGDRKEKFESMFSSLMSKYSDGANKKETRGPEVRQENKTEVTRVSRERGLPPALDEAQSTSTSRPSEVSVWCLDSRNFNKICGCGCDRRRPHS